MEIWTIESNPTKQLIVVIGILIVGIILAAGFRNFTGPGLSNSLAGFLLGVLLIVIGIADIFSHGKQNITIDPHARMMRIVDTNLFSHKERIIGFSEITGTGISHIGDIADGAATFYVQLSLRDGSKYPLFFPAYYDGRHDRSVAENRRRRLDEYLQATVLT